MAREPAKAYFKLAVGDICRLPPIFPFSTQNGLNRAKMALFWPLVIGCHIKGFSLLSVFPQPLNRIEIWATVNMQFCNLEKQLSFPSFLKFLPYFFLECFCGHWLKINGLIPDMLDRVSYQNYKTPLPVNQEQNSG